MKFEFLEHTADIKFRAYGKTMDEAFENAVLAVSSYLSSGKKVAEKESREIELEGEDKESLLYNLLDEVIYFLDAEDFLVSSVKLRINEDSLIGEFRGDKAKNYEVKEVKAATYAEMVVKKDKDVWVVQAVMDV